MANSRFLQWMERRGSYRMIERDGEDYLERYFIYRGPLISIYIHRIWASDADDLHCHPWWNFSLILKGSYFEHFLDGTCKHRKKGAFVFRDARSLHRLELPYKSSGSTWSLFVKFKNIRKWGFLTPSGWVAAEDYDKQPVEIYGRDFMFEGKLFPKFIRLKKGKKNEDLSDRIT